jgi:GT2 family glycosyltransferase
LGGRKQQRHTLGADFTVFSFTNGRSTYEYSARSVADSWDRQAEIVVLRNMHFLDAVHKCLESCQTPYFIKVDDDFILHPKAIAYMRQRVLEYPHPEELGIYYCHLWEDWTSRVRQSIKVYRTEALRQIGGFQVDHLGKVDEATKAALRQAGYKVVKDPSVVALHACGSWQEQLEYERLWSSMAEQPYRKPTHEAMKEYCGTKSLEKQYAMRLEVLEFINQQLSTPFHEFLRQDPGGASTASQRGMPTLGNRADGGSRSTAMEGPRPAANGARDETAPRPVTEGPPQVSVVTACRNAQAYLPDCLESIVGQTMSEWELLLIDDGSTDGTRAIMEDYARRDRRIKPCCFDDSTGPYIRRNAAIKQARGQFIVIQDADDIMVPHKLQTLYDAISCDDRLGIVGSFYWKFLAALRGIKDTEPVVMVTTHEQILHAYQNQMAWDFTWHGSAIIRKGLFEEIGGYDENPFGADSFWLAKAAEYARHTDRIRLSNIPEFLTLRRMHDNSQTGTLPAADPRGRRVRYWQYCLGKLQQVSKQAQENPQMDIARALRECTCGDFLTRFRARIPVWEAQPLDGRVVPHFLRSAVTRFNDKQYVSCVRTLRDVETMNPTVSQRVVHFNLLRAMALMGLGLKAESLAHMERELDQHNSPAAQRFHQDYFQRELQLDVQQWCAENAERYNLGLMEAETRESPARSAGMNVGQEQGAAL